MEMPWDNPIWEMKLVFLNFTEGKTVYEKLI